MGTVIGQHGPTTSHIQRVHIGHCRDKSVHREDKGVHREDKGDRG